MLGVTAVLGVAWLDVAVVMAPHHYIRSCCLLIGRKLPGLHL